MAEQSHSPHSSPRHSEIIEIISDSQQELTPESNISPNYSAASAQPDAPLPGRSSEEEPPPAFNPWTMPILPVIEPFKEMTLACRFVPTDQWLTTRVDRTWTVAQAKVHMLTKLLGARRDQLAASLGNRPSYRPLNLASPTLDESDAAEGRLSISSSNYSSVVFTWDPAFSVSGENEPIYGDEANAASLPSLHSAAGPSTSRPSTANTLTLNRSHSLETLQPRFTEEERSDYFSHKFTKSIPSYLRKSPELTVSDLQREEALERLFERVEASAKHKVSKAAKQYNLVSFSNGNILDDNSPLSSYSLHPFELLEIQRTSRCIRLPRPTYLDTYFESFSMVRVRAGTEKHGVEFVRRLRQVQQEERAKAALSQNLTDAGLDYTEQDWGTGLSAVSNQKSESQKEEERRIFEKLKKEEEKKSKRERKEHQAEKWKRRIIIVQGNILNIWKDPVNDAYPEQSWDLRRAVEVQVPRSNHSSTPTSNTQAVYAALALSSNFQTVPTRAPDKDAEKKSKNGTPSEKADTTLHIRFSIPLSSIHASLNPAAAAAMNEARSKRSRKVYPASIAGSLASLGAASTLRMDSTDPYNQGVGFGTSTLEGAGTATLVLRLPDGRTREHLCRIIHRSAGKYPLAQKRRKRSLEPLEDLAPVSDPDPDRRLRGVAYPDWRMRVLKKGIASGRAGFLSSSGWNAVFNQETDLFENSRISVSKPRDSVHSEPRTLMEEDEESLASDMEWEGWRRDLEEVPFPSVSPIPPRNTPTFENAPWAEESMTTPRQEIPSPWSRLMTVEEMSTEQSVSSHTDQPGYGDLLTAKRLVIDAVVGKGIIPPQKSSVHSSWTSFSSSGSAGSSMHSHDDHHASDGDTRHARHRNLALTPVFSPDHVRARSATIASSNPTRHSHLPTSSVQLAHSSQLADFSHRSSILPEVSDAPLTPIGVSPTFGNGFGAPVLPHAGTTITTISVGTSTLNSAKRRKSKLFSKWEDITSETAPGRTSISVGSLVRSFSRRDR